MSLKEGYKRTSKIVFKAPVREKKSVVVNGIDLLENVPPRTENEVGSTVLLAWPQGGPLGPSAAFWGVRFVCSPASCCTLALCSKSPNSHAFCAAWGTLL